MSPETVTIGGKKYHLTEVQDEEKAQEAVKAAKKAGKEEASSGSSTEEVEDAAQEAAEEKGMSEKDAKMFAKAVVAELKEGGYIEENGENGNSEADKEGGKETSEESVTGDAQSTDDAPESTHKWYRK